MMRSKGYGCFVKSSLIILLLLVPQSTRAAAADGPMEIIRGGTDRVLSILGESKAGRGPSLRQREGEVLQVVSSYFNFDEMAKISLGPAWNTVSPENRREFAGLFKKLLFNTYLDRMENYHNQEVVYDSQSVQGDFAVVKTHFRTSDESIPIDYRMQKEGGRWKVYDVVVQGVGYDANYRAQIASILSRESFNALLGMLRAKVDRNG